MRLLVRNLTDRTLTLGFDKKNEGPHYEVSAAQSIDIEVPGRCSCLAYITPSGAKETAELASSDSTRHAVRIGTGVTKASWRWITSKPDAQPWQMYSIRASGLSDGLCVCIT